MLGVSILQYRGSWRHSSAAMPGGNACPASLGCFLHGHAVFRPLHPVIVRVFRRRLLLLGRFQVFHIQLFLPHAPVRPPPSAVGVHLVFNRVAQCPRSCVLRDRFVSAMMHKHHGRNQRNIRARKAQIQQAGVCKQAADQAPARRPYISTRVW